MIRWRAEGKVNPNHLKPIFKESQKRKRYLHLNTGIILYIFIKLIFHFKGTHGYEDGTTAFTHPIYMDINTKEGI